MAPASVRSGSVSIDQFWTLMRPASSSGPTSGCGTGNG